MRTVGSTLILAGLALGVTARAFADDAAIIGLDDLIARVGQGQQPTGAGVIVAQIEAPDGSGDFHPNMGAFPNQHFILHGSRSGVSGHAQVVATDFYGPAIAPNTATVHLYEAGEWVCEEALNVCTSEPPGPTPPGLNVLNASWIGTFGDPAPNNRALRRIDYLITQDNLLVISGVGNAGNSNLPLLSHTYNGLSVGRMDGGHVWAATTAGIDGPGRMKPELLAPGVFTSYAAPVVSAAASLLVETSRSIARGGQQAARSEVIKAGLLCGAVHQPGWSNGPSTSGPDRGATHTPLDPVFGADLLNIDRSHQILTSGSVPGGASPESPAMVGRAGWDLPAVGTDGMRFWSFTLTQNTSDISIIATWHRRVDPDDWTTWSVADFELVLWRVTDDGVATLIGPGGASEFTEGNVLSDSEVDNIEHLFLRDLDPGEYLLELHRKDADPGGPVDVAVAWYWPDPGRVGDLNGDEVVNVLDLLYVLGAWGACPPDEPCVADLNGDEVVNVIDLLRLLSEWG